MLDLLITNASLPDGRTGMSVAVQNGRSPKSTPAFGAGARDRGRRGQLLTPPFCDPHFHMDATLSYGMPRVNESGTLLEGIALWGELKPTLKADDMIERALTYCDWAVAQGLLAIRSHVDTSDPSLLAGGGAAGSEEARGALHRLQLVAFPQDGVLRSPGGVENLKARVGQGRGHRRRHPPLRAHDGRGRSQRQAAVRDRGRARQLVDMHCDETDDPDVAPHRNAGFRGAAPGPAGPRQRQPLHLHAQHGQLLREQADPADCRECGVSIIANP
jgi:cytosine deaminase